LSVDDYSEAGGKARPDAQLYVDQVLLADGDVGHEDPDGQIVLSAEGAAGMRADRFVASALADRIAGLSRSRVQRWIELGAIVCPQRTLSSSTRLGGFESLLVSPLPREADSSFSPDPVALCIVYEDEDILVIDKPAGLVVHPAPGNWRNTLLNGLLYHRPAQRELPRAGIVHRLDKDTSGLMVVARSERALASLTAQLADRSMSRRYLAIVDGIAPMQAEIEEPIGRDPRMRLRMAVVQGVNGKPARTSMSRLGVLGVGGQPASLVECRLSTGRTHQIRVHMKSIGHPLLGDALYGGRVDAIGRQALHAWRLGLSSPSDGDTRHWTSLPPIDLMTLAQSSGCDLGALLHDLDASISD
jgi:23S rRNA pseudouridine1911/1915/1917 synthase